jgi:hypothetical protein
MTIESVPAIRSGLQSHPGCFFPMAARVQFFGLDPPVHSNSGFIKGCPHDGHIENGQRDDISHPQYAHLMDR